MATSSSSSITKQQVSSSMDNNLNDPHELYLVILNSSFDHILAQVVSNDLLTLPTVRPLGLFIANWKVEVEKLERFIKDDLGLSLRLLRPVHITDFSDLRDGIIERDVLALELIDKDVTLAASLKWIHRRNISDYSWVNTHNLFTVSEFTEDLLQELNYEASHCNQLTWWQQPGWHNYITSWTMKALQEKGLILRSEIRTCAYGIRSRVMTCHVQPSCDVGAPSTEEHEVLYIKATIPEFKEVARTVAIAEVLSPMVPEVVVYDTENGIMVQRDAGRAADHQVFQGHVMSTIKKMQSLSMNDLLELEKSGVEVRDMKWMFSNLERILNDPIMNDYKQGGEHGNLIPYLEAHVRHIKSFCQVFDEWNLPNVLVHADAHKGNFGSLVNGEEYYRVFDWADAFIGPPMYDVYMMDGGDPGFSVDSKALIDEFVAWQSYITHSQCQSASAPMELLRCCNALHHCLCSERFGSTCDSLQNFHTTLNTLYNFVHTVKGLEDKFGSQR